MKNASVPHHAQVKGNLRAGFLISVLAIFLGTAVGAIFFYAGLLKHLAPYQFAEAILAYNLIPMSLVGFVAAVLPMVELTAGFFLVLGNLIELLGRMALSLGFPGGALLMGGIKRRSCLMLIAALAMVFIIVLAVTWARGLKIDCGCGLFFQRQVGPAAILENMAVLAITALLYWWEYPTGGASAVKPA